MKSLLKNLITGETVMVHATTDSPDSSYGLYAWVDDEGNSYGQCQFGAPLDYTIEALFDVNPDSVVFRQCQDWIGDFFS